MNCPAIRNLLVALVIVSSMAAVSSADDQVFSQWSAWPYNDGNFFPICVWLQNPSRAAQYKAIGINTYVGLWDGPNSTQLSQLAAAGLHTMCDQNTTALTDANKDAIIGWLLPDEPDNAQSNPSGGYYSPRAPYPGTPWATCPYTPISTLAAEVRGNDATRPVVLNLGQGVAWDGWVGRGIRTNHPEDYPEYIASVDIASFDIYPGNSTRPQTAKKYELVAYGVGRLAGWINPNTQSLFNCIEVSNINGDWRPEADKIRFEIWSAIVHGSKGLIYFCHEFSPFVEAGVLQYDDVCEMLTAENAMIKSLAQVINSPDSDIAVTATPRFSTANIKTLAKRHGKYLYIFAVNMTNFESTTTFNVAGFNKATLIDILDEGSKTIISNAGDFSDQMEGYGAHIYRVPMTVAGDANEDGNVDLDDFIILKQNYGVESGATWSQGDFNSDGKINLDDFILLKQNYGS